MMTDTWKFADTVIVSLLNNEETSHGQVIDHFATWCQDASLELNASKTKDLCIDFRCNVINTIDILTHRRSIDRYRLLVLMRRLAAILEW